jgi:hypothetical protein
LALICPRCQTRLSDDTAICDNCNFIIDAAFLGGDITNEQKAAAKADVTRVLDVKPTVPDDITPPPRVAAPADSSAPKGPSRLEQMTAPHASVSEAADDLVTQFNSFPFSERLSTGGALAFLVSMGLPWHYSDADDAIGLFAGALPLGLVSVVVLLAAFIRREARVRKYVEEILVVALAASTVTLGGTAVFFSRSFERVWVSMAGKAPEQQWKLLPHVGLVIALVAGIVMLIGSAVTYRDRLRSRLN